MAQCAMAHSSPDLPRRVRSVPAIARIALWFGALLLSALLFSAVVGRGAPNLFVTRITLLFALPAWLLYLPFVVAYTRATHRQLWILLGAGILIGPASLAAWGALLLLRGESGPAIWRGDPLLGGMGGMMLCAILVGSLTTIVYVCALRLVQKN
jgi:hypothetical protein